MGSGFKDWTAGDVLTAADVDGYLMRQTVMTFADASARDTALSGVLDEGMVAYLEDTDELTVYDGSDWVIYAGRGYQYVQTVYFTSSGSFTKASYPWLRAIRVKAQGAGGGGGGTDQCTSGEAAAAVGGGGGCYAESFITNIASLASSVTVTIGAGGAGGTGGDSGTPTASDAADGGDSSFGSGAAYEVSAGGGFFGRPGRDSSAVSGNDGEPARRVGTGDLVIGASATEHSYSVGTTDASVTMANASARGASVLGAGGSGGRRRNSDGSNAGSSGGLYGGGGGGAATCAQSSTTDGEDGGAGADGIVIVELYA